MGKAPYGKPWLSYSDQVVLLQSRGLIMADPAAAERFLAHLNYYRFSGYCLAFESQRHVLAAPTTFEQVRAAYEFDLTLRDLVSEALEVVEVDIRTAVAYVFGAAHGPFGHTLRSNFFVEFEHPEWATLLREEATRSKDRFVQHFKEKYAGFPDLPLWSAMEIMSFGSLSKMIGGMLTEDQNNVARRYGLHQKVFANWTHHFNVVRNICAHHARLWDRVWRVKPLLLTELGWQGQWAPRNDRLYITLLALAYMLKRCGEASVFYRNWRSRVHTLLATPPSCADPLRIMSLPADWSRHPEWEEITPLATPTPV